MSDFKNPDDNATQALLERTKTIALVGASPKAERPSNGVMKFLLSRGYHVIPVNPGQAGGEIHGQKVFATLGDIPEPVDMVDIFRRSEFVPSIVEQALAHLPALRTIWMQLGVHHAAAAARAEAAGITVIQNRCPKIEYPRLIGA